MITFSVLISVYKKENPTFLKIALDSVWDNQSLKPSEFVIVKDGFLTRDLDDVITNFCKRAPVKIVQLEKNSGLGVALAKGLVECKYDLVARMDSDDIALSKRFEEQIGFMSQNPNIHLLSSYISEFNFDPEQTKSIRKVPISNKEILRFSKSRNPMNHMAVVFRKNSVLKVGNYVPFPGYEDYYLWVRMLNAGFEAHNLNQVFIQARVGNNMLARRQGYPFFVQEIKLQKEFLRIKHIGFFTFAKNTFLRALPRLLPVFCLKVVYSIIRKN
jgi:glycosyltransferase involved in cell wall biosynthesis